MIYTGSEVIVRFYLLFAGVIFAGLVGVALAGAEPQAAPASGCHGSKPKASCHGEEAEASCHGRSTILQRRADRQEQRIEARQAARAARAEARSCHGAEQPKCCECPEDCCCN